MNIKIFEEISIVVIHIKIQNSFIDFNAIKYLDLEAFYVSSAFEDSQEQLFLNKAMCGHFQNKCALFRFTLIHIEFGLRMCAHCPCVDKPLVFLHPSMQSKRTCQFSGGVLFSLKNLVCDRNVTDGLRLFTTFLEKERIRLADI